MSPRRGIASTVALAVLAVTIAGCASSNNADPASSEDASGGVSDFQGTSGGDAPNDRRALAKDSLIEAETLDSTMAFESTNAAVAAGSAPEREEQARSLISTGNVALRSDDVGAARFDVQKVVNAYRGEVSQEETATDDEGEIKRSMMVLRIPSADFAEVMGGLEGVADLITSSSNIDDVTTKVIDNDIRVRVQRRSIKRIELLLDRAQTIRSIIAIETQLARRQADLSSLERQQSYLADQTSMATITVSLERTPEKPVKKEKKEKATGFVAGLDAGWTQFKDMAVGIATASGAALPFLVVLLLLAIPGVALLWRVVRRRTPEPVEA